MGRRTRVFNIPGDLEWIRALGLIRKRSKGRWTRDAIERRLDSLENCIAIGAVPDARGRCLGQKDGHTQWEGFAVPDGLAAHIEDLREAVTVVRRYLASDDLEEAAERMDGIEALVQVMCDRVSQPHVERGHTVVRGASKGGNKRRGKFKTQTHTVLAKMQRLVDRGQSVQGAAAATARKKIGTSKNANRALWYRHNLE